MSVPFPRLEPIEIVTSLPFGARVAPVEPLPRVPRTPGCIRQAMEEAVLQALLRPPCVVSFSGGRDSSAVLAVAVHVARREGLELPRPVTLEFDSPESREHEWQVAVIRHLGLDDWSRIALTDELELLGDVAQRVLRLHGVSVYGMPHIQVPLIEAARGGSLLTGSGGDEIFRNWPWSRAQMAASVLRERKRSTAFELALTSLPPPARRAVLRWRRPVKLPWLTAAAKAEATRRAAERAAIYQPTFQGAIDAQWASRTTELLHDSMRALAAPFDVEPISPFATPQFLGAVRASVPPTGFRSRTDAMRELFGDLLPPETVSRSTKARFTEVFWGAKTRDFVAEWDGAGAPDGLVDVSALRKVWAEPRPSIRSWALLHHVWLTSAAGALRSDPSPHR